MKMKLKMKMNKNKKNKKKKNKLISSSRRRNTRGVHDSNDSSSAYSPSASSSSPSSSLTPSRTKHVTRRRTMNDDSESSNTPYKKKNIKQPMTSKKRKRTSIYPSPRDRKKPRTYTLASTRSRRPISYRSRTMREPSQSPEYACQSDNEQEIPSDECEREEEEEEEEEKLTNGRKKVIKLLKWDFSRPFCTSDMSDFYPESLVEMNGEEETKEGELIFKNMQFLITGFPFSKTKNCKLRELTLQLSIVIKAMGGTVVENLNKKPAKNINRPGHVVIAPYPSRTEKFVLGLAGLVPCLHYHWIVFCYKQRRYIDPTLFLLPTGKSISSNTLRNFDPSVITDYPPNYETLPFYNAEQETPYRIETVGTSDDKSKWDNVITTAGGKAVNRLGRTEDKITLDYVVSEKYPPDRVQLDAHTLKVPICNLTWLIECLILQRVVNPKSNKALFMMWEDLSNPGKLIPLKYTKY
eukprot:TRINITY_DN310_c2_g1_i1.p1 TRINITY_DN310_c2_g1~~TRINITY_DN310_c2_g1_i1.p1  ORF type:complete len:466 (+),score=78.66 TRINITY_DN310_c2_g1_i1:137-1534(+)